MSSASSLVSTAASTLTRRLPPITAASFRPTFVSGRWHKPAISAMQRAALRKSAAQLSDEERAAIPERTNQRTQLTVKFKGHKAERLAPAKSAHHTAAYTPALHQAMHAGPARDAMVREAVTDHLISLLWYVFVQGEED